MPSKPFSPEEAGSAKSAQIPDVVYDAVNELLTKRVNSSAIRIDQDELVDLILSKSDDPNMTRDALFANNWLDIEGPYRSAGWKVEYDKPAYCESYSAHFIFTKPRKT